MIQQGDGAAPGWFEAVVLGLVEGLTEFLPVSSTGHLIVTQRALGMPDDGFSNAFLIGIQFGAISAIVALYGRRLVGAARQALGGERRDSNLLALIFVAALPVVLVALLFESWIDANLFSPTVVACTLVIGGVLLLLLERRLERRPRGAAEVDGMTYRTALWIGLWQCLSLIPGTSRSGATIAGALVVGLSRTAAAEFSFLVGIPVLYGASLYKLYGVRASLGAGSLGPLLVSAAVAFVTALLVVRPLLTFLRRRNFVPFAYYRIVAGVGLFALIQAGYLDG